MPVVCPKPMGNTHPKGPDALKMQCLKNTVKSTEIDQNRAKTNSYYVLVRFYAISVRFMRFLGHRIYYRYRKTEGDVVGHFYILWAHGRAVKEKSAEAMLKIPLGFNPRRGE